MIHHSSCNRSEKRKSLCDKSEEKDEEIIRKRRFWEHKNMDLIKRRKGKEGREGGGKEGRKEGEVEEKEGRKTARGRERKKGKDLLK